MARALLLTTLALFALNALPVAASAAAAPDAPLLPPPADEWEPGYIFFNPSMCMQMDPYPCPYWKDVVLHIRTLIT